MVGLLAKSLVVVVGVALFHSSQADPEPFKIFRRHSLPGMTVESRQGRNSKLMHFGRSLNEPIASPISVLGGNDRAEDEDEEEEEEAVVHHLDKKERRRKRRNRKNKTSTTTAATTTTETTTTTTTLPTTLPVLEKEVAEEEEMMEEMLKEMVEEKKEDMDEETDVVVSDDADIDPVTESLINDMIKQMVEEEVDQEKRGGKEKIDDIGIHNLADEEKDFQIELLQNQLAQAKNVLAAQQASSVQQPINLGQQEFFPTDVSNQKKKIFANQPQALPKQQTSRRGVQARSNNGLLSNFGTIMGDNSIGDPENNNYVSSPQLASRPNQLLLRQEDSAAEDDMRCINKVMQVEETVYDETIKCQHTFTEKCHDTYITDYIPTQEKKCETSFEKNCRITYKPMVFEEKVSVCNEPLVKTCSNDTVGEEVCNTHYETNCETRYKEHEVEQDEPVCEMVTERRCDDVNVPLPQATGFRRRKRAVISQRLVNLLRQRRQADDVAPAEDGSAIEIELGEAVDPENIEIEVDSGSSDSSAPTDVSPSVDDGSGGVPDFTGFGFLQSGDSVNVGAECEEWPVQKCRLDKRLVKKVTPETACRKVAKEICAPSNCAFEKSAKVCHDENRNLVQNVPDEVCGLEPRENCKMETVLVPRLIQQPNCIKVPKEVCVNAKTNPRKVKKPVIKEWCYKPSDLKAAGSRLALSQFFQN